MRVICGFLLCISFFSNVTAQKIRGVASVGLLTGNSRNAVQVLGGIGVKKNSFSLLLLSGLDTYVCNSVPIMVAGEKQFGQKLNTPFVFIAGGYNIAAVTQSQKQRSIHFDAISPVKYNDGYIAEAGAGYKLKMNFKRALKFSVGYSRKTQKEDYEIQQWNGYRVVRDAKSLNYTFNRIAIKCAIEF